MSSVKSYGTVDAVKGSGARVRFALNAEPGSKLTIISTAPTYYAPRLSLWQEDDDPDVYNPLANFSAVTVAFVTAGSAARIELSHIVDTADGLLLKGKKYQGRVYGFVQSTKDGITGKFIIPFVLQVL